MGRLILFSIVALAAGAQTAAFDVASIKPNHSLGAGSAMRLAAGRVTMENVSLKKVVLNAYDIPDDREYMLDGPGWLTTEHFDISATFAADTQAPQVRRMLQTLMAERFKLALHRETRQLPAYSLVVAKNGPKIHPVQNGQGQTTGGRGRLEATKITIPKLADLLARSLGTPVIDATGLEGVFDFTLEWSPDEAPGTAITDGGGGATGTPGPSLFTALQEQLGLKLESVKAPIEVLVVDRIEKTPTEN